MEMNYATKGEADAALATGIIGTALGAMNTLGGGAALLGGFAPRNGDYGGCNCSENHAVNRYEFSGAMDYERQINELRLRLAESNTDVKLRDANIYTDKKIVDTYAQVQRDIKEAVKPLEDRVHTTEEAICGQAVYNGINSTVLNTIKGQIDGLTKLVIPNSSVCPGWGDVKVEPVIPTP